MVEPIKHNPHPDFQQVEASRPDWDPSKSFRYTKTADPNWKAGDGSNGLDPNMNMVPHVAIDPYEADRPAAFNYKILISSIVPRPIAFISTCSADGTSTNLAPFSYFSMINHDPPLFIVGFVGSIEHAKDTLRNIVESGECVINIISEGFAEAANATSASAPYGVSEWDLSGLTPVHDCETVRPARVGEAVVSIEAKLDMFKEYSSRNTSGKKTGTMVVLEGTRFWIRQDALNPEKSLVDPAILRPISRLGGITYGRVAEAFEALRPKI
ncbi:Flavin-Reduct domain-containing protein [Fusarium sp. Ph1]|nr:Flavin-Reduct domain-containing protein [Fusarium sp. Ph1]